MMNRYFVEAAYEESIRYFCGVAWFESAEDFSMMYACMSI